MKMQHFRWYALRPWRTNLSYPSTQQITNLIQCGVATGITSTYNATKTPNELLYPQLRSTVPCSKAAKTSFFLLFYCTHNYSSICVHIIQILDLFQSQHLFLYMILLTTHQNFRHIFIAFLLSIYRVRNV